MLATSSHSSRDGNGLKKQDDYSNNENIYNWYTGQEMHDNEQSFKETGLQASKMPKGYIQERRNV